MLQCGFAGHVGTNMSDSASDFISSIVDSQILSSEELQAAIKGDTTSHDAASQLVAQGRLTQYQADHLLSGNSDGLVLDEYVVLDKIGQGGMGTVLKARHKRLKRLAAVKLLSDKWLTNDSVIQRFYREVEVVARLSHPNIVTAYDARELNGQHCLIMEFVHGADLAAVVNSSGPLDVGQAVNCIAQAAEGLCYAHEHGVIHRDIKPANLLLSDDGSVKVLDLGLARLSESLAVTPESDQTPLTEYGQVMGTVDYMSPEQAEDSRTADERSDIYSLGCTLHFLLMASPPYAGETLVKKLLAHGSGNIPSLMSRGDLPDELETAFRKMVEPDVSKRFQSMEEVIAAMKPLADASVTVPMGLVSPQPTATDSSLDKTQLIDSGASSLPSQAERTSEPQSNSKRWWVPCCST